MALFHPSQAAGSALSQLPAYQPGQRTLRYAGIGARLTPAPVLARMRQVAARLAQLGYTLLSGGATGADTAFAEGAGERKQVFLAQHARQNALALALVEQVHPNPDALGTYARELMARNAFQVFGADLDAPVDFVLAWTPDGAQTHAQRTRQTGGTGQAISLASLKGVPVINLARAGWEEQVRMLVVG
jgi:hypothetical protein